jgi:hypothetical protein
MTDNTAQNRAKQNVPRGDRNCSHETAVSRAVRTRDWSDSLRTHTEGCAFCSEIVGASRWMRSLTATQNTVALPDASVVWWRAQFAQKQRTAERAQNALAWCEIAAAAFICAGLAGWVAVDGRLLASTSAWMVAAGWPAFWVAVQSIAAIAILTPVVFSSAAVAISAGAISVACVILARD